MAAIFNAIRKKRAIAIVAIVLIVALVVIAA